MKTTLRELIAKAAQGTESDSDGEGEWEEAGDDEAAEAIATLEISKPADAKAKAAGKKR